MAGGSMDSIMTKHMILSPHAESHQSRFGQGARPGQGAPGGDRQIPGHRAAVADGYEMFSPRA